MAGEAGKGQDITLHVSGKYRDNFSKIFGSNKKDENVNSKDADITIIALFEYIKDEKILQFSDTKIDTSEQSKNQD